MAHLPLIVIVAQRLFGPQASTVINTAVGFTLMRYAFIAVFALAWLIGADSLRAACAGCNATRRLLLADRGADPGRNGALGTQIARRVDR